MGVHVLRNLWDGVAAPDFRAAHIFAMAFAVISIELMRPRTPWSQLFTKTHSPLSLRFHHAEAGSLATSDSLF